MKPKRFWRIVLVACLAFVISVMLLVGLFVANNVLRPGKQCYEKSCQGLLSTTASCTDGIKQQGTDVVYDRKNNVLATADLYYSPKCNSVWLLITVKSSMSASLCIQATFPDHSPDDKRCLSGSVWKPGQYTSLMEPYNSDISFLVECTSPTTGCHQEMKPSDV